VKGKDHIYITMLNPLRKGVYSRLQFKTSYGAALQLAQLINRVMGDVVREYLKGK
jgi:hypothetical protein